MKSYYMRTYVTNTDNVHLEENPQGPYAMFAGIHLEDKMLFSTIFAENEEEARVIFKAKLKLFFDNWNYS